MLHFQNEVDPQSMLSMTVLFRVPATESKEVAVVRSNQLESDDRKPFSFRLGEYLTQRSKRLI